MAMVVELSDALRQGIIGLSNQKSGRENHETAEQVVPGTNGLFPLVPGAAGRFLRAQGGQGAQVRPASESGRNQP